MQSFIQFFSSNLTITDTKPTLTNVKKNTKPSLPLLSPHSFSTPSLFEAKYTLKDQLGVGGFGHIYSATRKSDGILFAIKFIKRTKIPSNRWAIDPELGLVPVEVFVLNNIHHDGIIQFVEMFNESGYLIIVQELFGHVWNTCQANITNNTPSLAIGTKIHKSMDLFELLDSRKLDESEVKFIFKQVVDIVLFLFQHQIIHGDIKDENILIDSDLKIKLIDFGGAEKLKGPLLNASHFHGTVEFACPEILLGVRYNGEASEVWSLGCLVYGMMYGSLPFSSKDAVINDSIPKEKKPTNPLFVDLMRRCLDKRASSRIKIEELVNHPWFQS